jgi:hypothetical protein
VIPGPSLSCSLRPIEGGGREAADAVGVEDNVDPAAPTSRRTVQRRVTHLHELTVGLGFAAGSISLRLTLKKYMRRFAPHPWVAKLGPCGSLAGCGGRRSGSHGVCGQDRLGLACRLAVTETLWSVRGRA